MIPLKNPYAALEGYHCFGCSPHNPDGLQMQFFEEGEFIVSNWHPGPRYQGFVDVLHGGIQATLMDEIASWVVFVKLGTAGMTYRMSTRYKAPVRISRGAITLRARLKEGRRRVASIEVVLEDGEGNLCSESSVEYFVLPREKAKLDLHYPGKDAFYQE